MEQYVYGLGLLLSDVKVDKNERLYILIEGTSLGKAFYKEVELPEEYQTSININKIKEYGRR